MIKNKQNPKNITAINNNKLNFGLIVIHIIRATINIIGALKHIRSII